jgi:hypothetical protein
VGACNGAVVPAANQMDNTLFLPARAMCSSLP